MKKRYIAIFLLIILIFACGCASKNSMYAEQMTAASAAAPAAEAPQMMMEETAVYDAAGSYTALAGGAEDVVAENGASEIKEANYGGRKIIRTLSLELLTNKFEEHLALIEKDTQTAGGYVQNSYVYGTKPEAAGDPGRSANFTLRIPVKQVDAFVSAAANYGTLISQNEDTEDVTDNYFDIETRLEVNRTTLERLKSILVKTNNLSDIIELEREIARVTVEIEDLTTRLRKYDGLIEYATVNIMLQEERMAIGPAAKTPFGRRVSEGFTETLSDVGNFLENLAVFLIAGLPVILPIALIALLVLWLRKKSIERDVKNGMPAGFVAWQRRAWRKDQRMIKKNANKGIDTAAPQDARENAGQENDKNEN